MMQTPIDYKKVSAIPSPQTVALINNFVINTTQFINKFAHLCEQKLSNVSRKVERLEITMSILEAKLASIPWLDHSAVAEITTVPSTTTSSSDIPVPPPLGGSGPILNISNSDNNTNGEVAAPPPTEPVPSSVITVKDDPRYAPWFKKLKYGAPEMQIKMQMASQGLDPNLLDTPDAPMPGGSAAPAASPSISRAPSFYQDNNNDSSEEESDEDSDESDESNGPTLPKAPEPLMAPTPEPPSPEMPVQPPVPAPLGMGLPPPPGMQSKDEDDDFSDEDDEEDDEF